ncbi:hypothetical protein Scep_014480 [Stephania cephalantha]|uniref:Uncharacterized protein n=1 Tax=Stephania cephalantha TaxID=152367 RepID=A0AAP0P0K3_9MAGN
MRQETRRNGGAMEIEKTTLEAKWTALRSLNREYGYKNGDAVAATWHYTYSTEVK